MFTLGGLVDQLSVVNLKMWNAQECLYKIRRMTFEEFKEEYSKEESLKELFDIFKKSCDLNVQRANITDEIDQLFVNTLIALQNGTLDIDKLTQNKHKTY
jgi:hypothetical protein